MANGNKMKMNRAFCWTLILLPLVLVFGRPAEVSAQSDLSVRVIPRFGLLSPDAYFYEEFTNFANDQPVEWTTGSLGRAALVSLALDVGFEKRGIHLRGELGRSFSGWLSAVHGIVQPRVLYDPPEIVNTWLDVPSTLTIANLQLVLPTQFELWKVRPYVLAGGGGKWYHFGSPTAPDSVEEAILPTDGFTPSLELGGGLSVTLFGMDFDGQVRDSVNRYWDKTQHDLIFSGGVAWRVR